VDATTLVSSLTGAAAVIGAVVAYLGKKSENALKGYTHLTDDLQEERDRLDRKVGGLERDLTVANRHAAETAALRAADQAEIARLRIENDRLRGHNP
jgi:hypothetical protein